MIFCVVKISPLLLLMIEGNETIRRNRLIKNIAYIIMVNMTTYSKSLIMLRQINYQEIELLQIYLS